LPEPISDLDATKEPGLLDATKEPGLLEFPADVSVALLQHGLAFFLRRQFS
jgi:hypothetical protein